MDRKAIIAASFLMGYWACLLKNKRRVPKYIWKHLKVAQQIVEDGSTYYGPMAVYDMIDVVKKIEEEALHKQTTGATQ